MSQKDRSSDGKADLVTSCYSLLTVLRFVLANAKIRRWTSSEYENWQTVSIRKPNVGRKEAVVRDDWWTVRTVLSCQPFENRMRECHTGR